MYSYQGSTTVTLGSILDKYVSKIKYHFLAPDFPATVKGLEVQQNIRIKLKAANGVSCGGKFNKTGDEKLKVYKLFEITWQLLGLAKGACCNRGKIEQSTVEIQNLETFKIRNF